MVLRKTQYDQFWYWYLIVIENGDKIAKACYLVSCHFCRLQTIYNQKPKVENTFHLILFFTEQTLLLVVVVKSDLHTNLRTIPTVRRLTYQLAMKQDLF